MPGAPRLRGNVTRVAGGRGGANGRRRRRRRGNVTCVDGGRGGANGRRRRRLRGNVTRVAGGRGGASGRRLRGDVGRVRFCGVGPQRVGVDVQHHLVAVAGRAPVELRRQGALRDQAQRVGL
ncbi:MAG: hypothetical protein OXF93_13220, partial [Acidobacteria bacterium]|nr:hypothetical protein [Acidobacteriota bacterium]